MPKLFISLALSLTLGACGSRPEYESAGFRECQAVLRQEPNLYGECLAQLHQRRMAVMQADPRALRALQGR